MGGTKHGPNRFDNYQDTHETVMEQFIRSGFVVSDGTAFSPSPGGRILIEGRIECLGGIYIDVRKTLVVLDGEGSEALVQTLIYNYHVAVRGGRNIFRYDSPDPGVEGSSPEHHKFHHKHIYQQPGGVKELRVETIFDPNDAPTLGEVIQEAMNWYYDHIEELSE